MSSVEGAEAIITIGTGASIRGILIDRNREGNQFRRRGQFHSAGSGKDVADSANHMHAVRKPCVYFGKR